ncbi:HAD-IA family hydrolase [Aliiroseovarius subalbicans]|uniref:HAD-IA family hydrolase n=1 Tax=Aliiroseovarius subalbicans TaxID=2925840 RepID=UPI001F5816B7|nr:HAD-IA family hydrolase [Aliiroseovarius subalbicans]MCI2399882.1 HAD-IA family hydrolase [Aliiroseovarius subalbicans]
MSLRALIFDVDGTLAETEEAHRAAFNQVFDRHGLGWHWSMDDYRELLKTTGGKERMRAFAPDMPADQIAALHVEKTALYGDILAAGKLPLRPGVAALMTRARAAGLKLAVATTTNPPNVEALAQCCWSRPAHEVFDVIAAGDQVAAKKPAPDVFQLALSRLGLPANDCVAFEDSLNGLTSANGAGLRSVVTPSIYTDDQDFSDAALVVPTLDGLSIERLAGL